MEKYTGSKPYLFTAGGFLPEASLSWGMGDVMKMVFGLDILIMEERLYL